MIKAIILVLLIGCTSIFQQPLSAQSNTSIPVQIKREIIGSLHSKTMNESHDFWVKLPENYNPNNNTKYPVVYLLNEF